MIIGSGDIARAIDDHPDFLFFASGVSDSSCIDKSEFDRELHLLEDQPRNYHIVYFSSLSIYHSATKYAEHKYAMEMKVRSGFSRSTIVRIGNITWGSNPKNLINYFRRLAAENRTPRFFDGSVRFILSKWDFRIALNRVILERPWEMNIHGSRMTPMDIYAKIIRGEL